MTGRIPDELVDAVRRATDIVDLVSAHVPLKRSGRNLKGLCPFHEEKTPSFNVNPERQTYRCFGCGEGGSAFTFLMAIEKVTFPEAVRILGDRVGISVRRETGASEDERSDLYRALRFAAEYYAKQLRSVAGRGALDYLRSRKIRDESIDRFRLGYAPGGWDSLLRVARGSDVPQAVLESAGLVKEGREGRRYDRFRNRIIFPIEDLQARVIGFGARALSPDDQPKYLNSPEMPIFNKSRVLYGINQAREEVRNTREIAVSEGYTDVIVADQAGVRGMVATLGTALTRDHARLIRRFADRVIIVFDADAAGSRASQRGVETILEADLEIRVARLPHGIDPCDFVLDRGGAAFREILDKAEDFFEFCIEAARVEVEGPTLQGKARMGERLLEVVQRVRNPVKQGLLIRKLSEELGLHEDHLRQAIRPKGSERSAALRSTSDPVLPGLSSAERAERDLLESMCGLREVFEEQAEEYGPEFFRLAVHRKLAESLFQRRELREEADLEGMLAEAEDVDVSRLLASFLNRERTDEEYHGLAQGAVRYFEAHRLKSDLRELAQERRSALERGDEESVNRLLDRTFRTIRAGDLSRRNRM